MKKLLEYTGSDALKGISAYANAAVGGLFQWLLGIDPFEQGGVFLPSLSGDSVSIGTVITDMVGYQDSNVPYLLAKSSSKVYKVLRNSPYTVTDVTSNLNQNFSGGASFVSFPKGSKIWKSLYVYPCLDNSGVISIKSNALPVASGSDKTLFRGLIDVADVVPLEVGADGNLYAGDKSKIVTMTNSSGTSDGTTASGNVETVKTDDGWFVRDLINDGRYLVILADNNSRDTANRVDGSFKCKVYFWDMTQTDGNGYIIPDAVYPVNDSYLIGGKLTDQGIEFAGHNGMYVCNIATAPKLLRPFASALSFTIGRPLTPFQMTFAKGSLYWLEGIFKPQNVYAHGNPTTGQPKIWYQPYTYAGSNALTTALIASGDTFIIATDEPKLYFFNTGSTRGTAQIKTLDTSLGFPFTYGLTKVVLQSLLQAGQTVQVVVTSANGSAQISSETKSYSAANAKQSFLFRRVSTGSNQPVTAEDFIVYITTTGGAAVQRFSVWGDPLEDGGEDI